MLEGELAQRADATRKLREVQKQLMLLGGLVPPSPVVTAAAAAAARGRRNSSNLASGSGDGSSGGGMAEEAALMQDAKSLQDAIDSHTRSIKVSQCSGQLMLLRTPGTLALGRLGLAVLNCTYTPAMFQNGPCLRQPQRVDKCCAVCLLLQELQEQWERARAEEQSRGAGAADVRRWTGIRNIVEAREMLRTLFISACSQRAQVSWLGTLGRGLRCAESHALARGLAAPGAWDHSSSKTGSPVSETQCRTESGGCWVQWIARAW